MSVTQDNAADDPQRIIADLRDQLQKSEDARAAALAEKAVLAEALAQRNDEFAERIEHQAAMIDVLKEMSASPDNPQPVIELIARQVKEILGTETVGLFEYDGELVHYRANTPLTALTGTGAAASYLGMWPRPPDRGSPSCRAILDGALVHIRDIEADPSIGQMVRDLGHRTQVSVPLMRDGRAIGALSTGTKAVDAISDTQIELLKTFAEQAAIAISSAEAHRALRQSLEHQAATIDVLKVISTSTGDTRPVFDTILNQAMALCDCMFGSLVEFDGELMHLRAVTGFEPDVIAPYAELFPAPLTRGISHGRAILDRAVIYTRDILTDPEVGLVARALGHRSQLHVPLMRGGVAIGALAVAHRDVDAFSPEQIELLETFAEQAVIAIGSTGTYRALQDRTAALALRNSEFGERIEQQAATIDVLKTMSSTPDDTQPVFEQIVLRARTLCNARTASLFEFDGQTVFMRAAVAPDLDPAGVEAQQAWIASFPRVIDRRSTFGRAILDKQVVHILDREMEAGLRPTPGLTNRSTITIPLLRDCEAIGAISIGSAERGGFTDSQVALLQTFAEQAVIAIGSVATFRALRERTAELAQRQNELRVTFENMGDGVAMFDETRHLAAWNRKFQDLLDVPDEIIARRQTFEDYLRYLAERGEYGVDADVDQQVRRLLDIAGQSQVLERVRPNGTVIEVRSNPVPGGGFVLIYADITERKRNEAAIAAARDAAEEATRTIEAAFRELKIAQANLVQAEKMASLGQLTAGIAHEIKNPLNFVNNFAALSVDLLEEFKEAAAPAIALLTNDQRADIEDVSEMLSTNLRKIEEHGKRADGIVKAMLEHSRGTTGERREVDLNALVDEAMNLAYHGARAQDQSFNITLERDYAADIAPIEVNPQDLTRVFLNIINNGFYAANKRGKVGDAPGFSPVLRVTTQELGQSVQVRIRDNGSGIPPDIRDKLFQPFFTTKPTGEGTGLGLSITYDIVTKAHGGTITVDSEVGSFTEFVVSLPRHMFAGEGDWS